MSLLLLFSIVLFLAGLMSLFFLVRGGMSMRDLANVEISHPAEPPLVSIIVPACNEEETLEPALRSLLRQDYSSFEIIVLDDRSTDGTHGLLGRLAEEFPTLCRERITELPPGWLGKNHALHRGAQLARGELLLFTDADVVMEPSTLSRAVTYFIREQLDHLCLIFRNITPGGLLNGMIIDAMGGLFLLLRPWSVRKPGRRSFIGVGAFNMIRRSSYRRLGGHAALKMHPIDDIMLGKKVRKLGMIQDCLLAGDFIQVRWYESVAEMVTGLTKNIYALYSYRLTYAAAGVAGIVLMTIVPPWGVILTHGATRIFFSLAVLCRVAVFLSNSRVVTGRSWNILWPLLTPYFLVYTILHAIWTTYANQGIIWRGTHYPLRDLKEQDPLLP